MLPPSQRRAPDAVTNRGHLTVVNSSANYAAFELFEKKNLPAFGNFKFPNSLHGSYLVDPASSHMLVSKIKPCMSKYKPN